MIIRELVGHDGAVNAVRFTKDGNYCLTASSDRTIYLWNPHKNDPKFQQSQIGLKIKGYTGQHGKEILDIVIANDNTKFASCGGDKTAFIWDVSTGNTIRRLQGHTQKINAVKINLDGTVLITASYDKTICCWDLRSNLRDPIQTMSEFRDSVSCLTLTDYSIVGGSIDGTVRNYDMRKGLCSTDNLQEPVISIALTSNQKAITAMCLGGGVHLFEISSGLVLKQYYGYHYHSSFKSEIVLSHQNDRLFCGSEDASVVCYNFLTGNYMAKIPLPRSTHKIHSPSISTDSRAVSSLSIHPSLPLLLVSQYDSSVKCIDLGA